MMMLRRRALMCLLAAVTVACAASSFWCRADAKPVFSYKDALKKSLMFFECQRSGKLPPNQRVKWRDDSALSDGALRNVDLVGGYYDAGDNIKFGFPMAFTVTMLSWGALQYHEQLHNSGELSHMLEAIQWGTDYFLKASNTPNQLWVQVGDPKTDHQCWERPEDMDTPRRLYKIDKKHPGTEIAAETAAALAASSIVFGKVNTTYSTQLLARARELFTFADTNRGSFKETCPFYCSYSGYQDELLWAAAWLYTATSSEEFADYIKRNSKLTYVNEFNWDLKYAGLQVLLSSLDESRFEDFEWQVDGYICSLMPGSPTVSVYRTPGGLIHVRNGANTQYVTSAAFLFSVYSDIMEDKDKTITCGNRHFSAEDLMGFAKQQVDYLLGDNPLGRSYMVGFGRNFPKQAHHSGSSVPSIHAMPKKTPCGLDFTLWMRDAPNPNLLVGAIVGGPDRLDNYHDKKNESVYTEPATYVNAPLVGVLAKLYGLGL